MNSQHQHYGIVFLCDLYGTVLRLLHDDFQLGTIEGKRFSELSILSNRDVNKFENFLGEILNNKASINWDMQLFKENQVFNMNFTGFIMGENVLVVGTSSSDDVNLKYIEELLQLHNEQINNYRAVFKSNDTFPTNDLQETINNGIYDEISKLNNTLINLQRELTKKNIALSKIDNLRKQFVSNVSHELKNPITAINLTVEGLLKHRDKLSPVDLEDLLTIIEVNANVLTEIVNDLLLLSRAESGKIPLELTSLNLNSIIDAIVHQMSPRIKEKEIQLEINLKNTMNLLADSQRVGQILRILIDNAVKYSSPKKKILINQIIENIEEFGFTPKKGILIEIKDFGIGIKNGEYSNLFQPFYRSQNAQDYKGTGLGLSIAKELTHLHNGNIYVKSEYGKGSSFYLFLPYQPHNSKNP
ncbi:MAG: putative Signal transduction histidine kinase [Promethearchaeota archaeon]|nr:MAG: putative Signal transduction histidine kinase [Candidatus Lokiarchaeota archaeon]